jgi:hypothetical protein
MYGGMSGFFLFFLTCFDLFFDLLLLFFISFMFYALSYCLSHIRTCGGRSSAVDMSAKSIYLLVHIPSVLTGDERILLVKFFAMATLCIETPKPLSGQNQNLTRTDLGHVLHVQNGSRGAAEWTFESPDFPGGLALNYTLCVGEFNLTLADVRAESLSDYKEPAVSKGQNYRSVNTSLLQRKLGVGEDWNTSSKQQRNVFDMKELNTTEALPMAFLPESSGFHFWRRSWCYPLNVTPQSYEENYASGYCDSTIPITALELFLGALKATKQFPRALEAVLSVIFADGYYQSYQDFKVTAAATVARFVTKQVPRQWCGLFSVHVMGYAASSSLLRTQPG